MSYAMQPSQPVSLAQRATRAATEAATLRAEFTKLATDDLLRRALFAVKSGQASRLANTYSDLLLDARYGQAARFFLDDLYGLHDVSQRDQSVLRMLPTLNKLLPDGALKTIVEALEMDALSENLDWAVAQQVCAICSDRQHLIDEKSTSWQSTYQNAYASISAPERRLVQISMVLQIGRSLDKLVKKPLLGGLLIAMSTPARAAGLASIHEFLMRGFSAFKQMKGADEFLKIIAERETAEDLRLRA
jgi:hypothetical protein